MAPKVGTPGWLLVGFWGCVVIAIAAVIRRMVALVHPLANGPKQMANLDAAFSSHATLTVAHIVPAALFVLVAAWILLRPRAQSGVPQRAFFLLGAMTGITAYPMSAFAVGGWLELSAVFVFDSYFLFSLLRAYQSQRRGDERLKREWMVRATGILLGIATTRPVMGVFFATSARSGLGPSQFFGIAFWIGFSINALVTEFWLHSKRRTGQVS